jgi:hypothetical protein
MEKCGLDRAAAFWSARALTCAIAVIVASVASGIKSPGFLVDEVVKSRKLVHIIDKLISIADTGVGARATSKKTAGD